MLSWQLLLTMPDASAGGCRKPIPITQAVLHFVNVHSCKYDAMHGSLKRPNVKLGPTPDWMNWCRTSNLTACWALVQQQQQADHEEHTLDL